MRNALGFKVDFSVRNLKKTFCDPFLSLRTAPTGSDVPQKFSWFGPGFVLTSYRGKQSTGVVMTLQHIGLCYRVSLYDTELFQIK